MKDLASRSVPAGRALASVLVVALASISLLTSVGFASADTGSDVGSQVAAPAAHLLGVPMGTLIWALLGLAALVVGSLAVGRTRNPTPKRTDPFAGAIADGGVVTTA